MDVVKVRHHVIKLRLRLIDKALVIGPLWLGLAEFVRQFPHESVTIGHSAGGHLALWAAGRSTLPDGAPGAGPIVRPCLAIGMAPVADLARAHHLGVGGQAVARLLGGTPDAVPGRYELASPAARLPMGVPQVLVHGTDDGAVPVSLSHEYTEAATAAGDDVELVTVPDEGHMACLDTQSTAWRTAAEAFARV